MIGSCAHRTRRWAAGRPVERWGEMAGFAWSHRQRKREHSADAGGGAAPERVWSPSSASARTHPYSFAGSAFAPPETEPVARDTAAPRGFAASREALALRHTEASLKHRSPRVAGDKGEIRMADFAIRLPFNLTLDDGLR